MPMARFLHPAFRLIGIALVAAGVVALLSRSDSVGPARAAPGSIASPAGDVTERLMPAPALTRVDATGAIFCVDSTADQPLAGALLQLAPLQLRGTVPRTLEIVATMDHRGQTPVLPEWVGKQLLVGCHGFVSQAIAIADMASDITVRLDAAVSSTVRCTLAGQPLEGCLVMVSCGPLLSGAGYAVSEREGAELLAGDPRVEPGDRVWSGKTDAAGALTFDTLPAGDYHLAVYHDAAYPEDERFIGSGHVQPSLVIGGETHVTMASFYGSVVALDRDATARGFQAVVDQSITGMFPGALSRIRYVERRLRQRLGTDLVRVVAPAHEAYRDALATVWSVVDTDGRLWRDKVPMLPVAEIEVPVFLEMLQRCVGTLVMDFRTRTGEPFSGSLEIVPVDEMQPPARVRHGESLRLVAGRYSWDVDHANPWFEPPSPEPIFTVTGDALTTCHVVLDDCHLLKLVHGLWRIRWMFRPSSA